MINLIREPVRKEEQSIEDVEERLYNLVKQYLKKQPFFSIEEIIEYSHQRLKAYSNVNKLSLEKILKSFIKKKQIIPGTKLLKEDILENPTRENIYNFILNNAGANINEVMKFQNIGSNQAIWHLDFLEKFQFVRSVKLSNQKAFFDFKLDSSYDKVQFYLRNEKIEKIIDFMENNESALKATNISETLKMNYNTVKKYLKILNELQFIRILKENGQRSYILDFEIYRETLDKIGSFK